ncbi:MAG: hypothetical protein GY875_03635 [Gammaproteobacteria bacterium]|nr:hypothetical protein [Gammaproteobacteria bacterium]
MVFFTHSFSGVIVLCFEVFMMSRMQNIFGQWLYSLKHYLLMCLLLSSPQRLPYSPYPLLLTGFAYFLIGLLLVDEQQGYAVICTQILLEMAMLGLISYLALRWKESLSRWLQTFTALVGINVITTVVALPVYYFGFNDDDSNYSLLVYSIQIWNMAILSLIFKRAFEISTQLSAMISFTYFIVYISTVYWLFY